MTEVILTEQLLEQTRILVEKEQNTFADEEMEGTLALSMRRVHPSITDEQLREKFKWGSGHGYPGNMQGAMPGGFLRMWLTEGHLLDKVIPDPNASDMKKYQTPRDFFESVDRAIGASGQDTNEYTRLFEFMKSFERGSEEMLEVDIQINKLFFKPLIRLRAQGYSHEDFSA